MVSRRSCGKPQSTEPAHDWHATASKLLREQVEPCRLEQPAPYGPGAARSRIAAASPVRAGDRQRLVPHRTVAWRPYRSYPNKLGVTSAGGLAAAIEPGMATAQRPGPR